ncbi:hypothetical protein GMDG_02631 [Pseudogymnoascus destructans 20631-21]|uniref:Uncharacterized protein n=1 Tax=Pseudogymnoascus destructans (strain ATCC MYA-4855 / 20631-21) TaxID=658429 RepID=L8G4M8_PSED2|nr:hypothetical protein GMDG_02631 [Pseudogymnoascus destructans 20631-21]
MQLLTTTPHTRAPMHLSNFLLALSPSLLLLSSYATSAHAHSNGAALPPPAHLPEPQVIQRRQEIAARIGAGTKPVRVKKMTENEGEMFLMSIGGLRRRKKTRGDNRAGMFYGGSTNLKTTEHGGTHQRSSHFGLHLLYTRPSPPPPATYQKRNPATSAPPAPSPPSSSAPSNAPPAPQPAPPSHNPTTAAPAPNPAFP